MSFMSAINDPRLRLVEMLGRRGAHLGGDIMEVRNEALAVRRCVFCSAKAKCDAWLASGETQGFEAFCPNALYIARRTS
jgi:hypothetical protein